jgi:hypothetical protein
LTFAEYLGGVAYLGVVLAAAAVSAWAVLLAAGRLRPNAPGALAFGLLAALVIFAAHLIPGALGVLEREAAALTAAGIAVAVTLALPRIRAALADPGAEDFPEAPSAGRWSGRIAIAAFAMAAGYMLASLLAHADESLLQVDVVSFHLSNVAAWIQEGSLWGVDDWIPNRAPGNYPQTGDVFFLAAMLPFESDFLARWVMYPFVALAFLAVYAGARELAVPRATAVIVASAVLAIPAVGYSGSQGLADPAMLGTFAPGAYFLLRHWRTGARLDLILAGVGLGLSFGTRWYAVFAVLAVLAVWLAAALIVRRPGAARHGAALAGLVAACGGFWLLRNWVQSGNPVFPVRVAPLGITIFDAPPDRFRELQGYSLADYANRPGILRDFLWPTFIRFMGLASVALWGLLAFAGLRSFRDLGLHLRERAGWPRGHGRPLAMAVAALLIVIAYVFTPYTASGVKDAPTEGWVNARYVIPALIVGAPAIAWSLTRIGRARLAVETFLLVAIAESVLRSLALPLGAVSRAWLLLVGVGLLAAGAMLARGVRIRIGRRAAVAGAVGALLAAVVLGAALERRYAERRYADLNRPIEMVNRGRIAEGARIGIVGDGFGNYPLFGPRLRNEVVYVGPRVREMLTSYSEPPEFREAINGGRFDYVVVQNIDTVDDGLPERQEQWLKSMGWRLVAKGPHPNLGFAGIEMRLYEPGPAVGGEGSAS